MDALSAGVRIAIVAPTARLRAYVATGEFPGLADVLAIVELFDNRTMPERDRDPDRRKP
jgi:hypothetical protein